MTDDGLQTLIDRLQGDVLDEARAKADALLREAQERADAERARAAQEAARLRSEAERDAALHRERGTRALEQAARDLLLATRTAVLDVVAALARDAVARALDVDTVEALLRTMTEAYAAAGAEGRRVTVLLSDADRAALEARLAGAYRERLGAGLELRPDPAVERGFRLTWGEDGVVHDLTLDALADALAAQVRPELAERLRAAAADPSAPPRGGGAPPEGGAASDDENATHEVEDRAPGVATTLPARG